MVQLLLIGFGAGVTAALLFATLATGQPYSVGLFYLTPLPILLAAIAWNHIAGAIAALTAALLLGLFLGGWFVLAFLVGIGVPAWLLGYLALLGRSDNDGNMEWYPPGRLVLAGALIAATATAMSIPALGTDIDSYRAALKTAFERVLRATTDTPTDRPLALPGVQDPSRTLDLLTVVMPPTAAVVGMVTSLFNLWLAGRVARISGRLARPWPDLSEMRFPPRGPLLLAIAVAGTFLPGIISVVATLFTATLLMAYALLGFAIAHQISRRFSARILFLATMWAGVFLIGWPILFAAVIGLADTFIDFRARFGAPTNSGPTA
jgi:hypothetical protein